MNNSTTSKVIVKPKTEFITCHFYIKSFILFMLVLTIASPVFSATYYMANTGSNSNSGTSTSPWLTLQYSMGRLSSGDTLIIKDGTYTGSSNSINGSYHPPISSSTWTTIKAENYGGVILDGEYSRSMFDCQFTSLTNCHWVIEGIISAHGAGSNFGMTYASYVKLIKCGAYDVNSGNTANFSAGRYSDYILFEGCYAWGSGRYKFLAYQSDHIIFRNCVARSDIINAPSEPCAQYSMYSVDYGLAQNCIAIDSDQTSYYTAAEYHGPFIIPSTDMNSNNVYFMNSIGLNIRTGGTGSSSQNYRSNDSRFINCAIWDCYNEKNPSNAINYHRGTNDIINHCTYGLGIQNAGAGGYYFNSYSSGSYVPNNTTINNTIIYGIQGTGTMFYDVENNDYNAYWGNTITNNRSGTHDLTTTNIIWSMSNTSGALKYLPRIESSSNLSGRGSDGSDIGANIITLIGTSGTLWGEEGYNSSTNISMWPFPNEALIKSKMAVYSNGGVSGARGFCTGVSSDGTPQTLTKYIWEYLGNPIPSNIYGVQQDDNSPATPTGVNVQIIN